MAESVWKYHLPLMDLATIEMVKDAQIVHVHEQHNSICIWAIVDPDEIDREERTFRIAGPGHILRNLNKPKYLGTVHSKDMGLVFHVFEVQP